jgi:uncharacterized membrane protein YhaH (DUF805 family)
MSDALAGTPRPEPTLRQRANAPRIGRARFIGNTLGYLVFVAIVAVVLLITKVPALTDMIKPSPRQPEIFIPNGGVRVAFTVFLMIFAGELAVRRRHDRGASSLSFIVFLELVLGMVVLQNLGPAFEYSQYIDYGLGLIGLYFFIVLCLLPGTKGPNRYGDDPRQH